MMTRWLNLYFRYSSFTFNLKQKIVKADHWLVAVAHALLLIISELVFAVISLPVYLLVPPIKIHQEGRAFAKTAKDKARLPAYALRRKISLTTLLGAGGLFLLKIFFIGIVSYYLLGIQQLLADTQDWTLTTPSDYIYNAAKVEVTGGVARLKNIGTTASGTTTNPGFDSNTTGWTYADWGQGGGEVNINGARVNSGGNPGGWIDISAPSGKDDELGGYWRQGFTTSVANPTTTLSFNYHVSAYDSTPNPPITFKIYAFIDTGTGVPVLGQEVWSSGEITATQGWTSISNLDVTSKVTAANTYYLKLAIWLETGGSNIGPYTVGFDNVSLNWSKTTVSYTSDKPTTTPVAALTVPKAVSWNSFTETATKNGGEIYYQLSPDNGTNWWYYTGSAWATTTVITNYNTASIVNANISKLTTSTNQIKWRAYLAGDGTQQVSLDNIAIGYTQNQRPSISALAPIQSTSTGYIKVNYNLVDTESDLSSLSAYEYSLNGTFSDAVTMTASTTDPSHSGVAGLTSAPAGVGHTFVWNAQAQLGNVYTTAYVRLRPNDGIGNGNYTSSTVFSVDYVSSTVSNVAAVQNSGSTTVAISYDLFDNTTDNLTTELQISGDGGATWTVATSTATGAIGSGVTAGNGKAITWNAGVDYPNQQKSNMQIRIRAKDKFQNQGTFTSSTNFSLDTLPPATLVTANLKAQPNAGDTTVLIGGSFTEVNPNTNEFLVMIAGGAYGATTTGDTNTAAPANQNTNVGATLTGHDYIAKVKIVHTDDFGLSFVNENLTPTTTYKYVKPYTPLAPTLSNPVTTHLDLQINANAGEASDVEYAIFEATSSQYVQSNGTLGASPVWQVMGTGSNQWGQGSGISGKVPVTGLSSPVAKYIFKVKSRNPNDSSHAASSESAYSGTAQITNTAPAIALDSQAQTTDGTQYVNLNYTGTDGQGDISSLVAYEYTLDGSSWHTMTEKSGAGSNGVSGLIFLPTGSPYKFVWNSAVDAPNVETSTAKIRLRANDTLVNGSLMTSPTFTIDNKAPVVANVTATQNVGAKTVAITYNLTEANSSLVQIEISADGGANWTVATSSLTGAVGAGVVAGTGKSVTWNAGVDFSGQYNAQMQVRVRARDSFGNQGGSIASINFTVDTQAPVITNLSATQNAGAATFTFHYDVSENIGNVNVLLAISANGGVAWTVATSTASGDKGAGVVPGAGKTITWNAGTDYSDQEKATMQFRIMATDGFSNNNTLASINFNLDTLAPRITNISVNQPLGGTSVAISYDLADQNNSLIELDISPDNGGSWNVATSTLGGVIGAGIGAGTGKTITWNAGTDLPGQNLAQMKIRLRGRDDFSNQSGNAVSAIFALDTLPPAINLLANLKAQPLAGATSVLAGGSFTEAHPSTNTFYVAINTGDYGSATAGTAGTDTPADKLLPVGATLDGNDYIAKIKLVETDDYNQATDNENTSLTAAYRYVKPYTPAVPTVANPTVGTVDVLINKNASETDGLEYAIFESTQNKYVQSNGALGLSPVWQTLGTGSGEWGQVSGNAGKITVNGLANHSYTYQFQVKSRNTSDGGHLATSESLLSSGASSANQSPVIALGAIAQTVNGTKYVVINYTGSDLESETTHFVNYQYSTDGSSWSTMSEKSGVGSEGVSGLVFASGGTAHNFAWDVGTNLVNTEDNTVYIRLKANDGTSDGGFTASSAFTIDTKNPVVASVSASQDSGSNNVTIGYNLTDLLNSTIELEMSADGGGSWSIATASASGDIGANIAPDSGKSISWNPGVDYAGHETSTMRTRIRATDNFGNQASFVASTNFAVDTKAPVFANVTAAQVVSSSLVRITYDLSDASSANVELDISADGGFSWTVTDVSVTGDVNTAVTPGVGKSIIWDAGADFPNHQISNMQARVRAIDSHNNATGNVTSNLFAINTQAPDITAVVASQTLGSNNVSITYNLFDSDNVAISIDISADGGSTWTVATSSATGDIGPVVTPGLAKSITWNAGVNYNNHENNGMKVRLRGTNAYGNTGYNSVLLGAFTIDTLAPVTAVPANLQAQPQAGETVSLIGGSFAETNPVANYFLVAINGGAYSATTTGEANTATPADQLTSIGGSLTGHDYISRVKIVNLDSYGHFGTNENIAPTSAYSYVKPYTPDVATLANPQNTSIDLTVNSHSGEASDVPYAIYELSTGKYVQSNGSLGVSPVWKILGTGAGQWGQASGVTGKVTVTGLTSPVATYSFKSKSRNPSDGSNAPTSESDYSGAAVITNTAPNINITNATQQLAGGYVLINYTGTDSQNDTNNLTVYEYSTDGLIWSAMTEKSGAGSDGVSSLIFNSTGTAYAFAWDVASDLPNQEQATVYVRLRSTDGLTNSNQAVSSALVTDTRGPVITGLTMTQTPGSGLMTFGYDLGDASGSNNNITLEISANDGSTYVVPITTLTGDVGATVTAGVDRTVTWDASTDFAGQESGVMKLRIRGTDRYGNIGSYAVSGNFSADAKGPIVSGVSASQSVGSNNVTINYTLADNTAAGNLVEFLVSANSGATWVVATTTRSGEVGAGQTTGVKSFAWFAGTDFSNQDLATMRVQVRAKDYFGNQGAYVASTNFALDTLAPVISGITASQTGGTNSVVINYDLGETATTTLDLSNDGGATWTVAKTTLTGALGAVTAGINKTVTWNAGTDFSNQENSTMRVRFSGVDSFGNVSIYYESTNFNVDTGAPLGLTALTKFSSTANSVTVTWQANTDAHFNHFELWHGANQLDVNNHTSTASQWSVSDDANLTNPLTISTVITGLTLTGDYYVKLWAIDDFGNFYTVPVINVYEAPAPIVQPTTAGGGVALVADNVAPGKPILNPLASPTRTTAIRIAGLAEPRSKVDLYDNGVLVTRLSSLTDDNGVFGQTVSLAIGTHLLTVRSTDGVGNTSPSSDPIVLTITTLAPIAPIILTPQNNSNITDATPQIVGVAEANNQVLLTIDNNQFTVTADGTGAWSFILPSTLALTNGQHTITATASDPAGNQSAPTVFTVTKITAPTTAPIAGEVISLPAIALINAATGATELAGIPVPEVTTAGANLTTSGDVLSFSGTSLPNTDVVVYIHSDQALVYQTRTDAGGSWKVNHSQAIAELTPGQHTIYAVTLDTGANVKSRPSVVNSFVVKRNFWVMIYNYLNWQTTVAALIVLLLAIFWLYRLRKVATPKLVRKKKITI